MPNETVSAKLDALLDPLYAIRNDLIQASLLAERNRLPRAFLQTINANLKRLDAAHDELLDIATALDPSLADPKP